ncbi:hypothetical protein SBBP2_660005 [Burkholderiales bacterium]|nr:hypothetical protein SBBP2_660005 [Burkholderiales bacterium]
MPGSSSCTRSHGAKLKTSGCRWQYAPAPSADLVLVSAAIFEQECILSGPRHRCTRRFGTLYTFGRNPGITTLLMRDPSLNNDQLTQAEAPTMGRVAGAYGEHGGVFHSNQFEEGKRHGSAIVASGLGAPAGVDSSRPGQGAKGNPGAAQCGSGVAHPQAGRKACCACV